MKASVVTALEALQAPGQEEAKKTPALWLDAQKEHVLALLEDKSTTLTAELLGLNPSTLSSWLSRRKLKVPRKRGEQPAEVLHQAGYLNTMLYWRGKAEALMEVVQLLAARGQSSKEEE